MRVEWCDGHLGMFPEDQQEFEVLRAVARRCGRKQAEIHLGAPRRTSRAKRATPQALNRGVGPHLDNVRAKSQSNSWVSEFVKFLKSWVFY